MFTDVTFQDWQAVPEGERHAMLPTIISRYKASEDFQQALVAQHYFNAENDAVSRKKLMKPQRFTSTTKEPGPGGSEIERTKTGLRTVEIEGNRVYSRFFYRVVTQENQHLLSNGVTIGDACGLSGDEIKRRLGPGFDTTMQQLGEKALVHGVAWGYWNLDHLEAIDAVKDDLSGFVALLDEETSVPRLGIHFWQLSESRPLYVRLFEEDGLTVYRSEKSGVMTEYEAKRPYVIKVAKDAVGEKVIGASNYSALPLIPLYANPEKRSELDNSLKSKIDTYDRICSDFADNLDRANDVYWVLNNFGGSTAEVCEMIEQIEKIRAVVNISDGVGGGSTAAPHTFEVPYLARQTALTLLEASIYKDTMSLSLEEVTGGSLTNVAIKAALTNLNLKCDRYEWQVYTFVQTLLRLLGIETEVISFVRQALVNQSETVADINLMRDYIDDETALKLNPYISHDEVPDIMERLALQRYAGRPALPKEVKPDGEEDADGGEDRAGDA